mgnify:FL=1
MRIKFQGSDNKADFDREHVPKEIKEHKFWQINKIYDCYDRFAISDKDSLKQSSDLLNPKQSVALPSVLSANFMGVMLHLFLTEHPFSQPHLRREAHTIDINLTAKNDIHWVVHGDTPAYDSIETAKRHRVNRFLVHKTLVEIGKAKQTHPDLPIFAAIDHVESHKAPENQRPPRLYGMFQVPYSDHSDEDDFAIIIASTLVPSEIADGVRLWGRMIDSYRKIPFIEIF